MIDVQGLDSPLLRDRFRSTAGEKELKLRFDVSQYCPEEILVKTVDNKLLVQAKHEENVNGRSEKIYRQQRLQMSSLLDCCFSPGPFGYDFLLFSANLVYAASDKGIH
jgi:hypothetical protein